MESFKPFKSNFPKNKCRRCTYSKYIYVIDLKHSRQEQKLYLNRIPMCKRCGFKNLKKQKHLIYNFDNSNISKIKIDLSKIKHEHNHNKIIKRNELDTNNLLCYHYTNEYCDVCDKHMELTSCHLFSPSNSCEHIENEIKNICNKYKISINDFKKRLINSSDFVNINNLISSLIYVPDNHKTFKCPITGKYFDFNFNLNKRINKCSECCEIFK